MHYKFDISPKLVGSKDSHCPLSSKAKAHLVHCLRRQRLSSPTFFEPSRTSQPLSSKAKAHGSRWSPFEQSAASLLAGLSGQHNFCAFGCGGTGLREALARSTSFARFASLTIRDSLRSSLRCGPYVVRDESSGRPLPIPPMLLGDQSTWVGLEGARLSTKAAAASTAAGRAESEERSKVFAEQSEANGSEANGVKRSESRQAPESTASGLSCCLTPHSNTQRLCRLLLPARCGSRLTPFACGPCSGSRSRFALVFAGVPPASGPFHPSRQPQPSPTDSLRPLGARGYTARTLGGSLRSPPASGHPSRAFLARATTTVSYCVTATGGQPVL